MLFNLDWKGKKVDNKSRRPNLIKPAKNGFYVRCIDMMGTSAQLLISWYEPFRFTENDEAVGHSFQEIPDLREQF
jgi:hypothetical protein